MPIIRRLNDEPYAWALDAVPLADVANVERTMPDDFITADGFGITEAARRYFQPLIVGEAFPPFHNGLPRYVRVEYTFAPKQLPAFTI